MISAPPDWFTSLLVCIECGGADLSPGDDALLCATCGAHYPVRHNVPLFLKKDSFVDTASIIGQHLGGVPPDEVESVFGAALRYRLVDLNLRGEFSNIVERYGSVLPKDTSTSTVVDNKPFELIAEYFNPSFVTGQTCYRSIRLKNNSQVAWLSTGAKPWHLSYFLHDLDDPQDPIEGVRSVFPIPLRPSHELTIPLRIFAPAKLGRYLMVVKIVQEFIGWMDPPVFETEIQVVADPVQRPALVINSHDGFFDFEGDLRQCNNVLAHAVELLRNDQNVEVPRVLEVACGSDPQTLRQYQSNTHVVACDIAFPQVQFGALQYASAKPIALNDDVYQFVTADVYNPPFRAGSFDLVVISAALHHFSNLTDALLRLSNLLQPNGLLVLMREPCKVAPDDDMFIQELMSGFNEQQFELEEYDEMFKRARFVRLHEQIDYDCSYKVILKKTQ